MPIPRYTPDDALMRMLESMLSGMPELGELQQPPKPFSDYVDESVQQYEPQGPTAGWTGYEQDIGSVGVGKQTPLAESADIGVQQREDAAAAKEAEGAAKVQQLKEAARQAQLDELASLEGMPEGKLWKIRAEARQRGRQGSLENGGDPSLDDYRMSMGPQGGGLSDSGPVTPELQQRLDANAEWLAGAPIRNAEFAMSTEQAEMRPQQAAMASDRLPRLQREETLRQKAANTDKLLSGLVGKSGKIPFESAMQVNMSGGDIYVPPQMIGLSPDQADREVSQIIEAAGVGMMQRSAFGESGPETQFEELALMLGQTAQEQLNAGADRDIVVPQLRVKIRNLMVSLGLAHVNNIAALNQKLGIPEGE